MPEIVLGLDVGSRNIKAAFVKRGKRRMILDAGVIKTPDGSVQEGAITYMDAVADDIKAYIAQTGIKPDGLAVSINSPDIITRNLTFPALSDAEIPPAVKYEILKLFPTIKDTHEITQRIISKDASSVSVLAALCPHELISSYQELAGRLGLPLLYADVRADAQAKAVAGYCVGAGAGGSGGGGGGGEGVSGGGRGSGGGEQGDRRGEQGDRSGASGRGGGNNCEGGGGSNSGSEGAATGERSVGSGGGRGGEQGGGGGDQSDRSGGDTGLLIDIGYRNSLLSVVSGGKLVLSRYIMNGSALYDNMAAEKSGAAREDIERARLSGDFSKIAMDPYDSESVMSMCFSDIVEQITQTANHYMSGISGEKLSYVAVVGEGGLIPGIVEYFAQSHSLAARELRPSDEASAACRALMKNENPNMLLAAVGAALAGAGIRDRGRDMEMNFAPALSSGAGGRQGFVFGRLTAAVAAAILIAAVSVAAGLYFIADQRRNTAEAVSIDAQISSDTQAAEHGEAVSIARRKLSALSAVADAIDARSVRASELLDELTTQAPESLFVINFSMADANSAALSGRARDYGSVSEFASTLRQTGLYDSVRINSISANESVSDARNDYSFTMTITFVTK